MMRSKKAFHRKSIRLPDRDYVQEGVYFVTICTKQKEHYFGEIVGGSMCFSTIGYICRKYWDEIQRHFDHVVLDQRIFMPNHIHGIIVLDYAVAKCDRMSNDGNIYKKTRHGVSLQEDQHHREFGKPIPGSLGMIINQFKGSVTRYCNKHLGAFGFGRQSGFYEHIIRNDDSLRRIRQYIIDNPLKRSIKNG